MIVLAVGKDGRVVFVVAVVLVLVVVGEGGGVGKFQSDGNAFEA